MASPITIVDLFSGPGGLGEGFASCPRAEGPPAYRIAVSIEKDRAAHSTLRLRAFLRRFQSLPPLYLEWLERGGPIPDLMRHHPVEWAEADHEAKCAELGTSEAAALLEERICEIERSGQTKTLLIGGPPCQAYSLAGRSRNVGIANYDAVNDRRNFLYEEYVRVLNRLEPVAFVMENVKGILSSSVEGKAIFAMVTNDLRNAGHGYRLYGLSADSVVSGDPQPRDFIVRAEDHGVPQMRHRVIIIGIRADVADRLPNGFAPKLTRCPEYVPVEAVIGHLPLLRSGLSKGDNATNWTDAMLAALDQVETSIASCEVPNSGEIRRKLHEVAAELGQTAAAGRIAGGRAVSRHPSLPTELSAWLAGKADGTVSLHETRGHMRSDLARYLFAACFGGTNKSSPRADEFPASLAPAHRNWSTGKFNDRFRVQLANKPASTITSHISKDGHYFIHYDPRQCRSLTVREAARLQTFPDDYAFLGTRTEQYVQVGNAVPPWLARQIAQVLLPIYDCF